MTDRKLLLLLAAAIAAATLIQTAALAQTPTGDATFPPGSSGRPAPLPPRPGLAQPSEQVPMPKRLYDPSLSTGKPEDCVDGTVWSPSLRGCMPPWHVEPPPPDK